MPNMIRKQVYIEERQDRSLKALAEALGLTESELIRIGIDGVLAGTAQLPLDDVVWAREREFIVDRARLQHRRQTRRWTRDDLYDE